MQNRTIDEQSVPRFSVRLILVFFLVFSVSISTPVLSLDILIGSSQSGTFNYHAGRILCRLINSQSDELNCSVRAAEEGLHSSDQIHTLTNVNNGALDLGIVDSATQYNVANRSGPFEFFDIGLDNLRSLFSLNGIPFTIVARDSDNLQTFTDLKDHKVNVGNPGSPQRAIMNSLMQINGWQRGDFMSMEELPAAQSQDSLSLCFGTVDVVVRFSVHPNPDIKHMVERCGAKLMNVSASTVENLIGGSPFYTTLSIPADTYAANQGAVPTFGLLETVITTEDLDEETAYMLVKLVFEQLGRLQASHPAFSGLTAARMHSTGLSMPLHPGALRYYREQGWML